MYTGCFQWQNFWSEDYFESINVWIKGITLYCECVDEHMASLQD